MFTISFMTDGTCESESCTRNNRAFLLEWEYSEGYNCYFRYDATNPFGCEVEWIELRLSCAFGYITAGITVHILSDDEGSDYQGTTIILQPSSPYDCDNIPAKSLPIGYNGLPVENASCSDSAMGVLEPTECPGDESEASGGSASPSSPTGE